MIILTEVNKQRKVLLLESVYYDGGVRLVDLSDAESIHNLLTSHTMLAYRKLNKVERDEIFVQDIAEALSKVLHKKYGMNFFNFWRRSNRFNDIGDDRKFHCGELVAKMYKMIGLIDDSKGS